ncbi:putative ferric-chelate reductase 1 [Orchesella cincta]|uniref:Putative ferric-chelate reductase 1 n=1 Tax=Orchesella cincta TaxID=48709 RepID=A0A1D2MUS6_ORCCI|nr:putative ferric-chelate reductase 1 [Orchesella cincta]
MTSIIITLYACIIVLFLSPDQTVGLKSGAPTDSCVEMSPKHPKSDGPGFYESQTAKSPFAIEIESASLLKGDKQVITLKSEGDNVDRLFRGFLVQVREANGSTPVGVFYSCPMNTKPVPCTNGEDINTLTHTDGLQSNEVILEWIPPSSGGTFQVYATFVENKRTFWVQQTSSEFNAEAGSKQETESMCPPPLEASSPSNTCTSMKSSPAFWIILMSVFVIYDCLLRAISLKFKK